MSERSPGATPMTFGRAVEVVGLVGIIVSLVFLGYELKRANDIAEAEAIASIYGMTNEMGLAMAENPELSRVFRQAQSDFNSLAPDDRWTFYVLIEYLINVTEAAWKYHDKGIITRGEAEYYTSGLCRLVALDQSLVELWRADEKNRIPGFYEHVTGVCEL